MLGRQLLPMLGASARLPMMLLVTMSVDAELQFHNVPADGDCLFSAVGLSLQLTDQLSPASKPNALYLRIKALDLLCPAGVPDPELILGELPASLVVEPLGGEGEADSGAG